ncbi:MAG: hypothetical protein HRT93_03135 [Piscirickettsiaceae bacterium]|nr:hypothetical protein [Piscirickettsiaceae bacterium]
MAEKEEESKKPKKRPAKRITPAQWAEAKALWESGEFTLSQIAEKIGSSREHLSRKFKADGILKGAKSESIVSGAEESIKDEVAKNAKILPMRVHESKERAFKTQENISKMMMMMAQKAIKDTGGVAAAEPDMKVLNLMAQIAGRTMDQAWKALGIDQEGFVDLDDLPELPIVLLTEKEMDDIRNKASAQTMGVGDGLGGILEDGSQDIVEEGFDEEAEEGIVADEG